MLDMRFVRENADLVKENLKRRGEEDKVPWVDQIIDDDKKWRSVQSEANDLRAKRNKLTEEIAQLRRKGQDTSSLVKQAEQIPDQIKHLEQDGWRISRTKGSHRQFHHPTKPGTVTVAGHPSVDIPPGTLNNILKQAGLK